MDIILSNASVIAMVVSALIGASIYSALQAISKYEKQKTDAEILRRKIAENGRDPSAEDQLTAMEKWELTKADKFDKIFLFAYAVATSLGIALACAVMILAVRERIPDAWEYYAVYAFVLSIVATWFINETVIKYVALGQWEKKMADAFRIVVAVVDKAAEISGGYPALVQKYIDNGFSKKEAAKLAKEAIVANPDLLKKEE